MNKYLFLLFTFFVVFSASTVQSKNQIPEKQFPWYFSIDQTLEGYNDNFRLGLHLSLNRNFTKNISCGIKTGFDGSYWGEFSFPLQATIVLIQSRNIIRMFLQGEVGGQFTNSWGDEKLGFISSIGGGISLPFLISNSIRLSVMWTHMINKEVLSIELDDDSIEMSEVSEISYVHYNYLTIQIAYTRSF